MKKLQVELIGDEEHEIELSERQEKEIIEDVADEIIREEQELAYRDFNE